MRSNVTTPIFQIQRVESVSIFRRMVLVLRKYNYLQGTLFLKRRTLRFCSLLTAFVRRRLSERKAHSPSDVGAGSHDFEVLVKSCDAEIVVQRELARFCAPTLQGPVLVGGVSGEGSSWSNTGSSSSPWSRFKVGLCW